MRPKPSPHRYVKTDYQKFSRDELLRRIHNLETYVYWLEQRDDKREEIKTFFHGGQPRCG